VFDDIHIYIIAVLRVAHGTGIQVVEGG